jgi:hypothetical protein
LRRERLAKILGEVYKLVKTVEEPIEEAKRNALAPIESAYKEVLLGSLYRLTQPRQPSLEELKEQIKEALGADLEEFLADYGRKVREAPGEGRRSS